MKNLIFLSNANSLRISLGGTHTEATVHVLLLLAIQTATLVNQLEIELGYEWSCFWQEYRLHHVRWYYFYTMLNNVCWHLISFKHGFLQTYISRWVFWYKQFYVFSISLKTSTITLDDAVVSHDLVGRFLYHSLIYFDWLVLMAQRVLYH